MSVRKILIATNILIFSMILAASYIKPGPEARNYYSDLIDGKSLSIDPCFSDTRMAPNGYITIGGYSQIGVNVSLTRGSGDGTYMHLRCWSLIEDDTTLYQLQAGTASVVDSNTDVLLTMGNKVIKRVIGDNNIGANNEGFNFEFDGNYDYLKCCIESDSTTDDVISATVRVSGKGK